MLFQLPRRHRRINVLCDLVYGACETFLIDYIVQVLILLYYVL
jgi:hypothetical protein